MGVKKFIQLFQVTVYQLAGGTVASGTELAVKRDCVSFFTCLKSGKNLKSKSVRSNLQATFQ